MEISNEKGKKVIAWDYSPAIKNEVQKAIAEAKSKVCAEFEKVCQTDKSFRRMVKEMHDIFDKLEEDITITTIQ